MYQVDKSMKEKFPKKNTSNEVKDELTYCERLIAIIENKPQIAHLPAVKEKLNVLKEAVEDTQEHLNYSTDRFFCNFCHVVFANGNRSPSPRPYVHK